MGFKTLLIVLIFAIILFNLIDAQRRFTQRRITLATPPPYKVPAFQNCTKFSTIHEYWVKFNYNGKDSNYCYLFPNYNTYSTNWNAAYEMCHRRNASLLSIHDRATNYILSHPLSLKNSVGGIYWMGMTSLNGKRGQYKWADRTPSEFFNWALTTSTGAPLPPRIQDQGRCVSIRVTSQSYVYRNYYKNTGLWFREDCNTAHPFVCQKNEIPPKPLPPLPAGGCPAGWYNANQKCIKYFNTPKKFTDANTYCQSQKNAANNGELLTIHSDIDQQFLTAYASNFSNKIGVFIGLSQPYYYRAYQWSDQSPYTYSNWGVQSGSFVNYQRLNCAAMVTNTTQPGKWIRANCTVAHPFICEVLRDPSVKTGVDFLNQKCSISGLTGNFIQYRKSCYQIMKSKMAFSDAENSCKGMGKSVHLASITDPYEQSFIRYYTSQKATNQTLLIGFQSKGASDTNDTQLFEWTDGWPVFYSNWMVREPKLPAKHKDQCVLFSNPIYSNTGSWKTVDCTTPYQYICKVSSSAAPNTNSGPTNGICPKLVGNTDKSLEWVNLHKGLQYCYWFSTERKGIAGSTGLQSWSDASFHCRRRNGSLVTLHSRTDAMIISDRLKRNSYFTSSWIGLSKDPEGDLMWEDGEPMKYTNWAQGEQYKNASNLNDDSANVCVEMAWDMTWKQVACNGKRDYFVCQTKKLYAPSSSSPSNGGRTAGIVIGVLFGIAALVGIGVYLHRKGTLKVPQMPSFDNPLSRNQKTNGPKHEEFHNSTPSSSHLTTGNDSPFGHKSFE